MPFILLMLKNNSNLLRRGSRAVHSERKVREEYRLVALPLYRGFDCILVHQRVPIHGKHIGRQGLERDPHLQDVEPRCGDHTGSRLHFLR